MHVRVDSVPPPGPSGPRSSVVCAARRCRTRTTSACSRSPAARSSCSSRTRPVPARSSPASPPSRRTPRTGRATDRSSPRRSRSPACTTWPSGTSCFYTRTQATETYQPPGAVALPPGNWGMNYYENGTVVRADPVRDRRDRLRRLGPVAPLRAHEGPRVPRARIPDDRARGELPRRAAATRCRALQCPAFEDDDPTPAKQTITGASTVRLGLHAAEQAARELGNTGDADRWAARRAELEKAIDDRLWSDELRLLRRGASPSRSSSPIRSGRVPLHDLGDPHMTRHAEHLWGLIAPSFSAPRSDRTWHAYEAMSLLALARIYRGQSPDKLRRLRTRTALDRARRRPRPTRSSSARTGACTTARCRR